MEPKPVIVVVRIWPLPQGFKASVRAVDGEEGLEFASAGELVRYLQALALHPKQTKGHSGQEGGKA